LAPTFSQLWQRLDENPKTKTSTPTKMAIGMIILGLGFVVMFLGSRLALKGPVSPLWLAAVYTIHTTGELCLSPIGLSMVTKLAPQRVVSLAMGLWFFSSFVANTIAGLLEGWLEPHHLPIYGVLVVSSIAPAILLLAIRPVLKTWMHGRA
jgi:POT family proton-dependent oligopeptide transporter